MAESSASKYHFMRICNVVTGALAVAFLLVASGLDHAHAADISYVYDELGRLRAVIDPSSDTAVYNYDAVGNLLSISRQASSVVSVIEFTPHEGESLRRSYFRRRRIPQLRSLPSVFPPSELQEGGSFT